MIIKMDKIDIEISSELLNQLNEYYYLSLEKETGGILLGTVSGNLVKILNVYEIKSNASTSCYYQRNVKKAQEIINEKWKETNGRINYIGEWHTHPNMSPMLSDVDIYSLGKLSNNIANKVSDVIMIIIGKEKKTSIAIVKRGEINAYLFDR